MPREVISLSIGRCGIQMSQAIWRQYLTDHAINLAGASDSKFNSYEEERIRSFFCEIDPEDFTLIDFLQKANTIVSYFSRKYSKLPIILHINNIIVKFLTNHIAFAI